MSTPLSLVASGSFTSDGAVRTITFPKSVDYFKVTNRSTWGTNPNAVIESFWYRGYAAGQAKTITESGAGALNGTLVAAGGAGFTEVDQSSYSDGAASAITAINQANPAVVSSGTTPTAGQIVRVYGTTGMLQVAGLEFTVGTVVAGVSFQLANITSAGFAAAATAGSWRLINDARFLPRRRWITAITAAASAVVTTSVDHGYTVGDLVTIRVPAGWGMTQINGRTGQITAITASTFTVNIDSSAFTAFAFPTSAVAAAGISFPHVVPFGEIATALDQPTDNGSIYGLTLGTTVVGANTNVMDWVALSRDYTV